MFVFVAKMKRLSSFGFVPLSSDSQKGQDKRPRVSQKGDKSSAPLAFTSQARVASPVQTQPSDVDPPPSDVDPQW